MLSHQTVQAHVYAHATVTHFRKSSTPAFKKKTQSEAAPSSIYIVGTGGTIAGTAASSTAATYAPSQLSVEQVIAAIPAITDFEENIHASNLFQVNSEDMTSQLWLQLAKRVNTLLASPDVKGVVITHGTDTLEETAYFLDLVVKSNKPVVIVGSMRASTSMSADGPLNLYNALAVIHAPESAGRGVMVMMNDTIYDARDVTKCNTTQLNTFNSPNSGPIGHVTYGKIKFEKRVERKNTTETTFDVSDLNELPTVEIVYEYAGSTGKLLKAAIALKPDGIVIAGSGDGNLHARDKALLRYASEAGIQIARSSRTGSGSVTETDIDYPNTENGTVAADNLNPQKARILLMLSLTQTKQACEIRKNFSLY